MITTNTKLVSKAAKTANNHSRHIDIKATKMPVYNLSVHVFWVFKYGKASANRALVNAQSFSVARSLFIFIHFLFSLLLLLLMLLLHSKCFFSDFLLRSFVFTLTKTFGELEKLESKHIHIGCWLNSKTMEINIYLWDEAPLDVECYEHYERAQELIIDKQLHSPFGKRTFLFQNRINLLTFPILVEKIIFHNRERE